MKDSDGNDRDAPFSFAVYNSLSQNSTGLPLTGTTGVSYSGAVTAVGGSGNYSWTVTGLSDDLTQSASGGTLTISGTPGSAATVAITVKLTDTTTTTSASDNYSIVISNPRAAHAALAESHLARLGDRQPELHGRHQRPPAVSARTRGKLTARP